MASKFIGDIQASALTSSGPTSFTGPINSSGLYGFHLNQGGYSGIMMSGTNATKSVGIHYGGSSDNKLRLGRYADNGGSWEANPIMFDMDQGNIETSGALIASGTLTSASATINGNMNVNGFIAAEGFSVQNSGGALSLMNPQGAQYATQTSSVTGAITIRLPVSWTNTMMRMQVRIYEYTSNESFDVVLGGYNYGSTNNWINTFAYILSDPDVPRNFNVRFGYNTTLSKCEIYIGETTSTWGYPQVAVTNFEAGYSNYAAETWNDGWDIVFSTAFGPVTATHTATQVGRYVDGNQVWHAGNDGAGSGLDADLLDGVQGSSYARTDVVETFNTDVHIKGDLKLNGTDSYIWTPGTGSGYTGFWDATGKLAMQYNESVDGWGVMQAAESGYAMAVTGDVKTTTRYVSTGTMATGLSDFDLSKTTKGNIHIDSVSGTGTTAKAQSGITFDANGLIQAGILVTNDNSSGTHMAFTTTQSYTTGPQIALRLDNLGNGTFRADVTAYSDERLKENIVEIPNALEKVESLRGVTFVRKNTGEASTGLVAQDVQKVLPEAVKEQEDGYLSVKYGNMVGLLVEAVKELTAQNKAQQAEIDALKEKLNGK